MPDLVKSYPVIGEELPMTNALRQAINTGGSYARDELCDWARSRECWDRASRYLKLARSAADKDVQRRFARIARHYRMVALAKRREAMRKGAERRSRATDD